MLLCYHYHDAAETVYLLRSHYIRRHGVEQTPERTQPHALIYESALYDGHVDRVFKLYNPYGSENPDVCDALRPPCRL